MKVTLEERFTDFELFQMFNVECNPQAEQKATRVKHDKEQYAFNDIKMPLWKNKKRKLTKRVKHHNDYVKEGITSEPAGKSRVADLARFYQNNDGESAFSIPDIDY